MHDKGKKKKLCLVAAVERHRLSTLIGSQRPHSLVPFRHTLDFK